MTDIGESQDWGTLVVNFWCCVPVPEAAAARLMALARIEGTPFLLEEEIRDAFFSASSDATTRRWEQFKLAWTVQVIPIEIDDITIYTVPLDIEWCINLADAFENGDAEITCAQRCQQLRFVNHP